MTKHPHKKQIRGEKIYSSAYSFRSQSMFTEKSKHVDLKCLVTSVPQSRWLAWWFAHTWLDFLILTQFRSACLGKGAAHSRPDFPPSVNSVKTDMRTGQPNGGGGGSSSPRLPSQVILGSQVDKAGCHKPRCHLLSLLWPASFLPPLTSLRSFWLCM